jgi:hypothetical protein
MQQNQTRLPKGSVAELSEKFGVHYAKASRLISGSAKPMTEADYSLLTEAATIKKRIQKAKEILEKNS